MSTLGKHFRWRRSHIVFTLGIFLIRHLFLLVFFLKLLLFGFSPTRATRPRTLLRFSGCAFVDRILLRIILSTRNDSLILLAFFRICFTFRLCAAFLRLEQLLLGVAFPLADDIHGASAALRFVSSFRLG